MLTVELGDADYLRLKGTVIQRSSLLMSSYKPCSVQNSTSSSQTMKFLSTVVTLALYSAVLVSGACDDVADGFEPLNGGTTGGRGGTVVTVSNVADLRKYATSSGKYIIKVAGTVTVTPAGEEIKVASDRTIVGVGNNAAIQNGGFGIHNVKNVITRKLRISRRSSFRRSAGS